MHNENCRHFHCLQNQNQEKDSSPKCNKFVHRNQVFILKKPCITAIIDISDIKVSKFISIM